MLCSLYRAGINLESIPDFTMFRAPFDGFYRERKLKNGFQKPTQRNVRALGQFLIPDAETRACYEINDWSKVIRHYYDRLGFFRRFYCGEVLPNIIHFGGHEPVRILPGDKAVGENQWHREARNLMIFADEQQIHFDKSLRH